MSVDSSSFEVVHQASLPNGLLGRFSSPLWLTGNQARQKKGHTWALVLAAGEGSRLQGLVRETYGLAIPKQFCSLFGGKSLLETALLRGAKLAHEEHVCTVVAEQHRHFWRPPLSTLGDDNIIVQPFNRGTANGVLYPLLRILQRDPEASVVLLPSDHHVEDEALFNDSIRQALLRLDEHPEHVHLLGIEPNSPDGELGYIVPGEDTGRSSLKVLQFVEKPSVDQARDLIKEGGLWNAFIVVAKARALLDLFNRRLPEIVIEMKAIVEYSLRSARSSSVLSQLYARLPTVDFSRHVLQGQEERLRVVPVPECGWSDLSTPKSLMAVLRRSSGMHQSVMSSLGYSKQACLSVAARQTLGS